MAEFQADTEREERERLRREAEERQRARERFEDTGPGLSVGWDEMRGGPVEVTPMAPPPTLVERQRQSDSQQRADAPKPTPAPIAIASRQQEEDRLRATIQPRADTPERASEKARATVMVDAERQYDQVEADALRRRNEALDKSRKDALAQADALYDGAEGKLAEGEHLTETKAQFRERAKADVDRQINDVKSKPVMAEGREQFLSSVSQDVEATARTQAADEKLRRIEALLDESRAPYLNEFSRYLPGAATAATARERGLRSGWTAINAGADVLMVLAVKQSLPKGASKMSLDALQSGKWANVTPEGGGGEGPRPTRPTLSTATTPGGSVVYFDPNNPRHVAKVHEMMKPIPQFVQPVVKYDPQARLAVAVKEPAGQVYVAGLRPVSTIELREIMAQPELRAKDIKVSTDRIAPRKASPTIAVPPRTAATTPSIVPATRPLTQAAVEIQPGTDVKISTDVAPSRAPLEMPSQRPGPLPLKGRQQEAVPLPLRQVEERTLIEPKVEVQPALAAEVNTRAGVSPSVTVGVSPDTGVREDIKQDVKTEVQPTPQPATEGRLSTKTVVEPKPRLPVKPRPSSGRKEQPRTPPMSYPEGTIAWKQGAVYAVWRPPYEPDQQMLTYQVERPVGVPIYSGPESAARSLTQIEPGKLPRFIDANLGFSRIQLARGRLQFSKRQQFPRKKVRF